MAKVIKQSDRTSKAPELEQVQKEVAAGRNRAIAALSPSVRNSFTAALFAQGALGNVQLFDALDVMTERVSKANSGDLVALEATLTAQSVALDSIFNEMARRAALNVGEHLGATETYLRLAFKAQAQCRSTLQTLAEIKNPRPVAFVRAQQANISQGHQQVNNGVATAHARGESPNHANELLEVENGKRMDAGAPGQACGADPTMATVEAVDRASHG